MSELLNGRHKKFILQVEEEEFKRMSTAPYSDTFAGKVIFSMCKVHPFGKEDGRWCNPFYDMAKWGSCYFQQVDSRTVQDFMLDKW